MPLAKTRVALIGTGHRGAGTWGQDLSPIGRRAVELVGLRRCKSASAWRAPAQRSASMRRPSPISPTCLSATRPDTLIVCTARRHPCRHGRRGARSRRRRDHRKADDDDGRRLPPHPRSRAPHRPARRRHLQLPLSRRPRSASSSCCVAGTIGDVASVDFHWYLDTQHGADYFRRWHAHPRALRQPVRPQGDASFRPSELVSRLRPDRSLRARRASPLRARRPVPRPALQDLSSMPTAAIIPHRLADDPWLDFLYETPSAEDGYFRDHCVFREEIDIFDTMSAAILYENGVQVSYSLNTFMPIEGYHLAFNGKRGRIEIRQYERQAWETPAMPTKSCSCSNFGDAERIRRAAPAGRPFWRRSGAAPHALRARHGRSARPARGRAAGAMSVLCGIAAAESVSRAAAVNVQSLL